MTSNDSGFRPSVPIGHLVVGVDLSPESFYALDLAATIGMPHRATLTVVHVHPQPSSLAGSGAATMEFERAEVEIDDAVAAAANERLAAYPGDWSVTTRRGQVAHELIEAAERVDADIIVVGHRSHGPIRDAILGSVATGTVHHSHRSIIIAVPPEARSRD